MATNRTKAERFGAAYRSLPVYWPVRWRLLWIARSDRRAGLPIGLSAETTPVPRDLVARRDEACENERTRYYADVRTIDVRLAEIDTELAALQRIVAETSGAAMRAAVLPSAEDLAQRRAGERDLAAELVRQRRLAEHRRLADAAHEAAGEARRRLDLTLAEEAELEARRQNRADVTRSRALRLVEYADRLAALYRRALIRRHPQRDALVSTWQSDLAGPPAWVLADDIVSSHRVSGAAA